MSELSNFSGPMERKVRSADGTWIFADAVGDPTLPPVVFIHGFACASSVFDQLVADPRLLANFYLVRYDLRGFGWSDHPEEASAYTSIRFAEDFAAVADAFNLKRPFLAGWSYGGTIGADVVAHLGADYLSGIILLAGQPTIDFDMSSRVPTPFVAQILPGLLATDDVSLAFSSRIKFASSFSSKSVPSGVISAWIGAMSHVTPPTSRLILTRTQDGTALFAAGRAGLPYLLIQGTEDLCINPNQVEEEINSFKDLTIKKLAGAGHILFYDALDETVQAILNFAGKHA